MSDRPTPETDVVYPPDLLDRGYKEHGDSWGWGTLTAMRDCSRRLERQRDELLDALYSIEERFTDGCDTYEDWQFMGQSARAAIAALKGGMP